MKMTIISDTHCKHKQITNQLSGGDIIIHSGDISSVGYKHEIVDFCKWFDNLDYDFKIFIAGNHELTFQDNPDMVSEIINSYKNISYLEDDFLTIDDIKIWGSPWTPVFYNWAFNGTADELEQKWETIPNDVNIVITHGPVFGHLDKILGESGNNLGCYSLAQKLSKIKPKMHICGHIHSGYGYKYYNGTHFFNGSVLDERHIYAQPPFNFDWDYTSNKINFYE
jgi:Icc-related predicted phosphoesterase